MKNSDNLPPHQVFHHEAMKTTFFLRICGDDHSMIKSLACECIQMIDDLERKLSCYFEGGDIYQINHMHSGETLNLSEECHECLMVAMEANIHTGGLFDPTLGALVEHRKSGNLGPLPKPVGKLAIQLDRPSIICESPGRVIDLGGIGKGFALDQLGQFLSGWDVEGALLSAGASTHLATGKHSWPIDLTGDQQLQTIQLHNEALSASGTGIQGCHIVHSDQERDDPNLLPTRIWSQSPSAALADAWSTALMLMTPDEIRSAPSEESMLTSIYLEQDDKFLYFG